MKCCFKKYGYPYDPSSKNLEEIYNKAREDYYFLREVQSKINDFKSFLTTSKSKFLKDSAKIDFFSGLKDVFFE